MIKDTRIDLTEESKFGRIFNPGNHKFLGEIVLPWHIKPVNVEDELNNKRCRLYGDVLSDDMGCVVRRCSDNKWFFGDVTELDKPWFDAAFQEELIELGAIKEVLTPCYQCGEQHIKPTPYSRCLKCTIQEHADEVEAKLFKRHFKAQEDFIPWLDYRTEQVLKDGTWQEEIVSPTLIIQELYK